LLTGNAEDYKQTASDKLEEGEDEVRSTCPLWFGLHMCYNGNYKELQLGDQKPISKGYLSPDSSLQLEMMKLESLVIVDQNATVNKFSSFVLTARRVTKVGSFLSALSTKKGLMIGAKS